MWAGVVVIYTHVSLGSSLLAATKQENSRQFICNHFYPLRRPVKGERPHFFLFFFFFLNVEKLMN